MAADDAVIGQKITDFVAKVTPVTYLENKSVINLQTFGDVGPYGTVGVTGTFSRPVYGDGSTVHKEYLFAKTTLLNAFVTKWCGVR